MTFYTTKINNLDINTLDIEDDVISISIRSCRLTSIPRDYFVRFTKLETIDLHDNNLEGIDFIIPDKVTNIDVSYNKIHKLDFKPNNLEYINLEYNFLDEIPECIKDVKMNIIGNVMYKKFAKQIISDNMKPVIVYPNLPRMNVNVKAPVVSAPVREVNVHETNVQNNTLKSIEYLISTYEDSPYNINYLYEMKMYIANKSCFWYTFYTNDYTTKNGKFFKLLDLYNNMNHKVQYNYELDKKCLMADIIERIWSIAKTKDVASILETLYIHMEEGKEVCFVGKYTRLVNTLTSFDEKIVQDIPFSEKFSNELTRLATDPNVKDKMTVFVNNSNISDQDKQVWLEALNEYF